jgi:hypothetical protein
MLTITNMAKVKYSEVAYPTSAMQLESVPREIQHRYELNNHTIVGFEVFTAVVMKSIIFWDMTPCSPLM